MQEDIEPSSLEAVPNQEVPQEHQSEEAILQPPVFPVNEKVKALDIRGTEIKPGAAALGRLDDFFLGTIKENSFIRMRFLWRDWIKCL